MENTRVAEERRRTLVLLRSHVERCLQDIWDTRELTTDADDDYPFRFDTAPCWVSLVAGPVLGVRVFGHAAYGLKPTAKLLNELNDLNVRARWATLALRDGIVEVSRDLHWTAVDRISLDAAIHGVGQVAGDVGPLLAAVHGGRTPCPPLACESGQDSTEEAA